MLFSLCDYLPLSITELVCWAIKTILDLSLFLKATA